jgi:hypothetical protein
MRLAVGVLCALATAAALSIDGRSVISALTIPQCDFMTGGGYINPQPAMGNKANFAISGWCRGGSFRGHLQFQDKTVYKKIHSVSITGYKKADDDDKARMICGHGKSDHDEDVDFVVRTKDGGGWGYGDEFDIQLTSATGAVLYTTFGGAHHAVHGGNVERHKHRPSDDDDFGGKCPPIGPPPLPPPPPPPPSPQIINLTVTITSVTGGTGTVTGPGIACVAAENPPTGGPVQQSGDCNEQLAEGTVVTLTAQATIGNANFTSACTTLISPGPTTQTCEFTLTAATANATVTFTRPEG